jgi:hypothetical protein
MLAARAAECQERQREESIGMYAIESPGHLELPEELTRARDEDVENTLRRAAAFLGWEDVEIARVASVIGGSCIACTDVVAYVHGTALLVAKPELY